MGAEEWMVGQMTAIHLTHREQEILVELAKGHDTVSVIADRLGFSSSAVTTHISNMCRKTGTKNKTQLLLWAFRTARRTLILETALNPEVLRGGI